MRAAVRVYPKRLEVREYMPGRKAADCADKPRDMELLRRCRELIREVVPGATVILYGSRARGDAGPDSDYDLLVLAPSRVDWRTEHRIIEKLFPLELETGAVFSVLAYSEEEWSSPLRRDMPLAQNVRREGIMIE